MAERTNTPGDWRFLADDDLAVAEHLATTMNPVPTAIIAFHCQQAVEKYMKGALAVFGEDPPYIHDLPELCKLVENHRPSFVSVSSLCSIITFFSVQPRYDRGLTLSEDDMRLTIVHTKTIKEFMLKEVPELFGE